MGYSNLSSETKNIICRVLGVIPDKLFLKLLYKIKTGRTLHLDNPQTYSEKLNWLKIYDRNPLYTKLVDKYEVRDYVKEKIGEEYLFPLLGVWDKFEDIDFDKLPNRFVLKCTHDFGSVVIVNDKADFDKETAKKAINSELKYNFFYRGREWAYKNVKPRIIAEENMQIGDTRLVDYKFFCFGGKVKYMYIATGRGKDLRFDFFTRDFRHIETTNEVPNADIAPEKPSCYEKMITIAEELAKGINNVRVDLYDVGGRVYFSELTFYFNGGMSTFEPYEMDVELGKDFILSGYTADKKRDMKLRNMGGNNP